jgi:predicted ATP-dependent Lon-type protease
MGCLGLNHRPTFIYDYLIPIFSAAKISTVPSDLFSKFQISFYEDPIDAVYKSLVLP